MAAKPRLSRPYLELRSPAATFAPYGKSLTAARSTAGSPINAMLAPRPATRPALRANPK
jgi:hypothetical protein